MKRNQVIYYICAIVIFVISIYIYKAFVIRTELEKGMEQGILRRPTLEETGRLGVFLGKSDHVTRIDGNDVFVVLRNFTYPSGIGSGYYFIIPKGVPMPSGDSGGSMVFDFNTMSCTIESSACFKMPINEPSCNFDNIKFPDDLIVYGAGGYQGRELPFQIDQSGTRATQMKQIMKDHGRKIDAVINEESKPVALILGAYNPTIWNIKRTKGTKIVAVVVSGYDRQIIKGLEPNTPLIIGDFTQKSGCGYIDLSTNELLELNPLSIKLFNKPTDMFYPVGDNGNVIIGNKDYTPENLIMTEFDPSSFQKKGTSLSGKDGLEEAMNNGTLRNLTNEEENEIKKFYMAPLSRTDFYNFPSYVVLKDFTFPTGLTGANAVNFIIPKGVAVPKGDSGHSKIYNLNTMTCTMANSPCIN